MKNLLSIFFALISVSVMATTPEPNNDGGYAIGDVAEDFTLTSTNGEKVSLSDYKDANGFVVIFTCNTCPYAMLYEDRIKELNKKYETIGYHVIAINPNDPALKSGDSFQEMKLRAKQKDFGFPYLFDESQEIFPKFGAKSTPHAFVLDKNRVVRYIGAIDDSPRDVERIEKRYVEDAIAAIEKGVEPDITYTKAIGCAIKSNKYAKLKGVRKMKKQKKFNANAKGIRKAKS